MSDGSHEGEHASAAASRAGSRGMTLPELLVAVAILLLIFSLVFLTARTVLGSSRRTRAQAQLQLLAAAIDRYAAAWPMWRDATGNPVADKAWPHWSPWALFPNPPYDYSVAGNCGMVNTAVSAPGDDDLSNASGFTGRDDVGQTSACLAYSLFMPTMGQSVMKDDSGVFTMVSDRTYPVLVPGGTATSIRVTLDPWGHPIRYLWVIRDADPLNTSGWKAISCADPTMAGVNDPNTDPFFARAQGYVLESAGADGRYGNRWKRSATAQELLDAEDNIVVQP